MVTEVKDFSYSRCKSEEAPAHYCHLEENRCHQDLQVSMCILWVGFECCEIDTGVMRCTPRIMDVLGRAGRAMGAAPQEELWWVCKRKLQAWVTQSLALSSVLPILPKP